MSRPTVITVENTGRGRSSYEWPAYQPYRLGPRESLELSISNASNISESSDIFDNKWEQREAQRHLDVTRRQYEDAKVDWMEAKMRAENASQRYEDAKERLARLNQRTSQSQKQGTKRSKQAEGGDRIAKEKPPAGKGQHKKSTETNNSKIAEKKKKPNVSKNKNTSVKPKKTVKKMK